MDVGCELVMATTVKMEETLTFNESSHREVKLCVCIQIHVDRSPKSSLRERFNSYGRMEALGLRA